MSIHFRHIILISGQPVFILLLFAKYIYLEKKQQIPIF